MTFHDREGLRKAKIISNQRKKDKSNSSKYWLTLIRKDTVCCKCFAKLVKFGTMVYLPKRKECICISCADKESVKYYPAFSYERKYRKKRNKRKPNNGTTPWKDLSQDEKSLFLDRKSIHPPNPSPAGSA